MDKDKPNRPELTIPCDTNCNHRTTLQAVQGYASSAARSGTTLVTSSAVATGVEATTDLACPATRLPTQALKKLVVQVPHGDKVAQTFMQNVGSKEVERAACVTAVQGAELGLTGNMLVAGSTLCVRMSANTFWYLSGQMTLKEYRYKMGKHTAGMVGSLGGGALGSAVGTVLAPGIGTGIGSAIGSMAGGLTIETAIRNACVAEAATHKEGLLRTQVNEDDYTEVDVVDGEIEIELVLDEALGMDETSGSQEIMLARVTSPKLKGDSGSEEEDSVLDSEWVKL